MATKRETERRFRRGARGLGSALNRYGAGVNAFADELTGGRSTRVAQRTGRGLRTARENIKKKLGPAAERAKNVGADLKNRAKAERVVRGNQIKEGVENLRNKAEGKVGSAADRANARIRREGQTVRGLSGGTPTGENLKGPRAKTPNVERTVVDRSKGVIDDEGRRIKQPGRITRALRGTGRALARVTPGVGTAALAGEVGFRAGQAGTEALLESETGQNLARRVGLGGPRSGITGQDTLDQINNPDLRAPDGTSGGFFSTDERSLNPGRTVADLDAGSATAPRPLTTAQQILSGDFSAPGQEQEDPVAGRTETEAETTTPQTAEALTAGQAEGPRRLTLRDALAGFQRSDNALSDAARLAARLNLTSSSNQALRQTQEFEEEQRQNDFQNAIDYSSAQLDRLQAAGQLRDDERADIAQENSVFQNQVNNINADETLSPDERQEKIIDAAQVQARKNGYDPREQSTQTLFTEIMRFIEEEAPSGVIQRGLAATGSGFKLGDIFDDDAPLLNASTIQNFSISNGTLQYANPDKASGTQPVVDLSDLPKSISQALTEMLDEDNR